MSAFSILGTSFALDADEYNTPSVTSARLTELQNAGVNGVRVNIPNWQTESSDTSFRNKLRTVCTTALGMGFNVLGGYTVSGGSNLTDTVMRAGYHDALTSMATWAQSLTNGNRFGLILGNEDDDRVDGSTVTTAQYQAYVRGTLANDVKAIFTKGLVHYNTHTGYYSDWKTSELGSIDRFGLNIYGSSVWNTYIPAIKTDFGHRGYVSEWNASDNGRSDFSSDAAFNLEINNRYGTLMNYNIPAFIFSFTIDSGTSQKWAFKLTDGSYRSAWNVLTGPRRPVLN